MTEQKIYSAICGVMKDVGAVKKTDENTFDHYKYRGIDAVMNALQPAMIKNNIFVIPEVLEQKREDRLSRKGEPMIYSVVTVKYRFCADDGSHVEAVVVGEAMDRGDKSVNKAMSAAYKYACFQTFCIPTEEMIDSETESPEIAPTEEQQKQIPMASDRQINFLKKLGSENPDAMKYIKERVKSWETLTRHDATEIIGALKK